MNTYRFLIRFDVALGNILNKLSESVNAMGIHALQAIYSINLSKGVCFTLCKIILKEYTLEFRFHNIRGNLNSWCVRRHCFCTRLVFYDKSNYKQEFNQKNYLSCNFSAWEVGRWFLPDRAYSSLRN